MPGLFCPARNPARHLVSRGIKAKVLQTAESSMRSIPVSSLTSSPPSLPGPHGPRCCSGDAPARAHLTTSGLAVPSWRRDVFPQLSVWLSLAPVRRRCGTFSVPFLLHSSPCFSHTVSFLLFPVRMLSGNLGIGTGRTCVCFAGRCGSCSWNGLHGAVITWCHSHSLQRQKEQGLWHQVG